MKSGFSNIDEYIALSTEEIQLKLRELRKLIHNAAPNLLTEKISYQMPTFWYQTNIIHFAVYKNHIGIYPGSKAIEFYKEQLSHYKTSKGAIQIPINEKIPKKIIQNLVKFNISDLKEKIKK